MPINDVAKLFALAQQRAPGLALFVILAAGTGIRRSELLVLRWTDPNMDAALLSIGRGLVLGPDGLGEKDTKAHAARRISLDPRPSRSSVPIEYESMNGRSCAA